MIVSVVRRAFESYLACNDEEGHVLNVYHEATVRVLLADRVQLLVIPVEWYVDDFGLFVPHPNVLSYTYVGL